MNMKLFLRKCLAATALASALLAASCQKENESPTTMTLAVNDNTINLEAKSGKEHVLVYAKGQWNADFKEAVEWAAIEDGSGKGNGEFILTYEKNPDILRRAEILITAAGVDKTITVTINQEGEKGTPKLAFAENEKAYIAWEVKDAIAVESNIDQSLIKAESSAEWIGGLELKDGQLSFTVAENTTGEQRKGTLTVSYTDIDEAVYRAVAEITQGSEPGHLTLKETEMAIEAFAGTKTVQWDCALGTFMPELVSSVTYEGSQKDWISNVTTAVETLSFDVTDNETKEARTAVIKVELASKGIAVNLKVTQGVKTKQYSFEELRALLTAAGEQTFDGDYFEGVIVADGGQKNMETNPMTSATSYNDNESAITNYVQSLDGNYGMRLKFATAADNTLKKGDKVKISLNGTTLVREDNPVRYTLKGVTANIVTVEDNISLQARQKTISELTDEDIYTWTTLKDVEIAFSYGSYNNVGTTVKDASDWIKNKKQNMDYRILSDASCSTINMLVNSDVEWLRTQNGVPQGSGDISGIIVNTENGYFQNAELLGGYQIRPMELSDIALGETGFSEKVVEWYWPEGKGKAPDLHYDGLAWKPSFGSGSFLGTGKLNQTSGYMETGAIADPKAMRWDSVLWNVADGTAGAGFTISFSTETVVAKKLVLVFSAAGGSQKEDATGQTPVNWNISYSVGDGTPVQFEKILIRPLPASGSTGMKLPLTPDEFYVELPTELLGKEKVTLKLQAADDTTIDFSTGEYTEKVSATAAQTFRFGAVVVKSIK